MSSSNKYQIQKDLRSDDVDETSQPELPPSPHHSAVGGGGGSLLNPNRFSSSLMRFGGGTTGASAEPDQSNTITPPSKPITPQSHTRTSATKRATLPRQTSNANTTGGVNNFPLPAPPSPRDNSPLTSSPSIQYIASPSHNATAADLIMLESPTRTHQPRILAINSSQQQATVTNVLQEEKEESKRPLPPSSQQPQSNQERPPLFRLATSSEVVTLIELTPPREPITAIPVATATATKRAQNRGSPQSSPSPSSSPRGRTNLSGPASPSRTVRNIPNSTTTNKTTGISGGTLILDWKPYDINRAASNGYAPSNVETILSPELGARKEEVARRKEAQAHKERMKYVSVGNGGGGGGNGGNGTGAPSPPLRPNVYIDANGSPTHHRKLSTAQTSPTTPAMKQMTSTNMTPTSTAGTMVGNSPHHGNNPDEHHISVNATITTGSGTLAARKIPNIKTSSDYDIGQDIFGPHGGGGGGGARDGAGLDGFDLTAVNRQAHAAQLNRKKSGPSSRATGGIGGGGGGGGETIDIPEQIQYQQSDTKGYASLKRRESNPTNVNASPQHHKRGVSSNTSTTTSTPISSTLAEIRMRRYGPNIMYTMKVGWYWITTCGKVSESDLPPPVKTPPLPYTRFLYNLLEYSRVYIWFSILLTIFSLFAHDFTLAFLEKKYDESMYVLLTIAFGWFCIELLLNIYCKSNYFLRSFLFWLDLFGTFSLCFDIIWINDEIFHSGGGSSMDDSTDSGSTHAANRSANILRLTKFARILRILKLIRIVRVFKLQRILQKSGAGKWFQHSPTPSRVGLTLAERQDKKVIGMIMLVLVLFPFFLVPSSDSLQAQRQMGLDMINQAVEMKEYALRDVLVQTYVNYSTGGQIGGAGGSVSSTSTTSGLFYLSIPETLSNTTGTVYYNDNFANKLSTLRSAEYSLITATNSFGAVSYAYYTNHDDLRLEYIYTICFTICVIIIFIIGSFLMSQDVQILVIDPLDRMTGMIKKLTGTILFLNQPSAETMAGGGGMQGMKRDGGGEGGHGEGGMKDGITGLGGGGPNDDVLTTGVEGIPSSSSNNFTSDLAHLDSSHLPIEFETEAIEEVISQMAHIFQVVPDPDSHLPKPLAMLSGSKHTQIKTMNSVVQIDVSERPRLVGEDEDWDTSMDQDKTMHTGGVQGWMHQMNEDDENEKKRKNGSTDSPTLLPSQFPELTTIEQILSHTTILPYFKLFLTSNLTLENLLFVQEVDRFRSIMKVHVLNLYNAFISPRAPNQVNIPCLQRDRILAELQNPSASIFDESQSECVQLMNSVLKSFQGSKFCKGYMKRHQARARGILPSTTVSSSSPVVTNALAVPQAKAGNSLVVPETSLIKSTTAGTGGTASSGSSGKRGTPVNTNVRSSVVGGGFSSIPTHSRSASPVLKTNPLHNGDGSGGVELPGVVYIPSSSASSSVDLTPAAAASNSSGSAKRATPEKNVSTLLDSAFVPPPSASSSSVTLSPTGMPLASSPSSSPPAPSPTRIHHRRNQSGTADPLINGGDGHQRTSSGSHNSTSSSSRHHQGGHRRTASGRTAPPTNVDGTKVDESELNQQIADLIATEKTR